MAIFYRCPKCGARRFVSVTEWETFKFSGFPVHCGLPMTREKR